MRELKFRWYDQANKEYIYFRPLGEDMVETLKQANEWTKRLNGAKFLWEQFTGLQDKNGRDIYEGDILATKLAAPFRQVVAWEEHEGSDGQLMVGYDFAWPYLDRTIEVIGNINETPELLKGE